MRIPEKSERLLHMLAPSRGIASTSEIVRPGSECGFEVVIQSINTVKIMNDERKLTSKCYFKLNRCIY